MTELYDLDFVNRNELTAVTGILPGGAKGTLKNQDGSRKDTRAIDSNECFVQQPTPYVYPLLKISFHRKGHFRILQKVVFIEKPP